MTIDRIVNMLVTFTLVEMMVAIGLGVQLSELAAVARDWLLVAKALVANYVLVPAATCGLLLAFDAPPMVAVGFLILAVCPGAPFAPSLVAVAKGNVATAAGLMVLLAGSSALMAPVLLQSLIPSVVGNAPMPIDATDIVLALMATQLAPLCVGLTIRRLKPKLAAWLHGPSLRISKFLNIAVVVLILTTRFESLKVVGPRALVGMLLLLFASLLAGWLLGGPLLSTRRALALATSLRNVGVGLVIANSAFPSTAAVTATLVYGLFEIAGSVGVAFWWRRSANEHVTTST